MLGKYDPRPVKPDSLFPVFSVTKGITAGMVHWLVDNGYVSIYYDHRVCMPMDSYASLIVFFSFFFILAKRISCPHIFL